METTVTPPTTTITPIAIGELWKPASILIVGLILALLVLLIPSPEGSRARGGGPGADIGNRAGTVDLHGQPAPFYLTPHVGQGIKK